MTYTTFHICDFCGDICPSPAWPHRAVIEIVNGSKSDKAETYRLPNIDLCRTCYETHIAAHIRTWNVAADVTANELDLESNDE